MVSVPALSERSERLEHRLGIGEPKELMLLEADQDLPPEVRKINLLLVDRSAGNKLPPGEGLYVFPVATGLAVKRVEVSLKRGFVVTGIEAGRDTAANIAGAALIEIPGIGHDLRLHSILESSMQSNQWRSARVRVKVVATDDA